MRQLGREVGLSVGLAEEIFLMIYLIYRKTVPIKWQVVGSEDLAYRWFATASMSAFDFRKDGSQSPSSREVLSSFFCYPSLTLSLSRWTSAWQQVSSRGHARMVD
jgi:hypothetical protein